MSHHLRLCRLVHLTLGVLIGLLGCGPSRKDDQKQTSLTRPDDGMDIAPPTAGSLPSGSGVPSGDLAALEDDSTLSNLPAILNRIGLKAYHDAGFRGQGLTIAVLDNGYLGLQKSSGQRLPPGIKVEPAPRDDQAMTSHGTKMAEIAYATASGSRFYDLGVNGPRVRLFNANGFTNFKAAVAGAIAAKVDMILYAQVWEFGGNWDGRGFINAEVSKATAAGILWINASGNLGLSTYSGPVTLDERQKVALPGPDQTVRFTVAQDGTPVKVVLAWNDFRDTKEHRTEQDLDLILERADGTPVTKSQLSQTGQKGTSAETYSAHAREVIQTQLRMGVYRVRVEAKSRNFTSRSRLRITVDGNGVRMLEATTQDSLPIPADHPRVLAVGANDVQYSGRNSAIQVGQQKPELSLASRVEFNDGMGHYGTSAATALMVGTLAAYQSAWGKLTRDGVVQLLQRGRFDAQDFKLPPPPASRRSLSRPRER